MRMNEITGGEIVNININYEEISKKINKKAILIIIFACLFVGITTIMVMNKNKAKQTLSQPENIDIASNQENMNDVWKIEEKPEKENKSQIYLTFDDGPSHDITPKILDILKEENVHATFFIINFSQSKEELIKREVQEGHSVGLHGYSHEYKKIYKSEETYMSNLNDLQAKVENLTGVKSTITRFPGGSSNTVSRFNKGVMTKLVKDVEQAGYKYYDWNVDSDDAGHAKNENQVYENVTESLKKERANVILMHDFEKNEKTLNALRDIIKFGKENGYSFNKISSDSDLVVHHHVQN